MTPEQKEKLLGLVFGFSSVGAGALFLVFLFLADNAAQALVYSGFAFIGLFVAIRFGLFLIARRYD
jgi:hypothetical protein